MSCVIVKNDIHHSRLIQEYLGEKRMIESCVCVSNIPELRREMISKVFKYAIIDFRFDGQNGFETARIIKKYAPQTHCIICLDPHEFRIDFLIHFDISGYLSLNHTLTELIQCLELLKDGYRYICSEIRDSLSMMERIRDEDISGNANLTRQEKNILKLLMSGKSTCEIAGELFLSINTINNHKTNIRNKLNLTSNRQLIFYAMNHSSIIR